MTRQKTYAAVYVRPIVPPVDCYRFVVIAKRPDGSLETEWFRDERVAESVRVTRDGQHTDPGTDPFAGVEPHRAKAVSRYPSPFSIK